MRGTTCPYAPKQRVALGKRPRVRPAVGGSHRPDGQRTGRYGHDAMRVNPSTAPTDPARTRSTVGVTRHRAGAPPGLRRHAYASPPARHRCERHSPRSARATQIRRRAAPSPWWPTLRSAPARARCEYGESARCSHSRSPPADLIYQHHWDHAPPSAPRPAPPRRGRSCGSRASPRSPHACATAGYVPSLMGIIR